MRRPAAAVIGAAVVVLLIGGVVYAAARGGTEPSAPGVSSTTATARPSWDRSRMASAQPLPLPEASSPDATTP